MSNQERIDLEIAKDIQLTFNKFKLSIIEQVELLEALRREIMAEHPVTFKHRKNKQIMGCS